MRPPPVPSRDRADACPGLLQIHRAADGGLARVRLPGGTVTAAQLRVLAGAARELGDGALELTSRGNVQLRGLPDGADTDLAARLADAGLLPSPLHDRMRNVLASALSGRTAGGHADVRPWVAGVDAALLADASLADLPGRFLATVDDGRGDVAGLGGDVGLLALPGDAVALVLAGADSAVRARSSDAVALLLAATRAYRDARTAHGGTAWRLAEIPGGPEAVAARLGGARTPALPVPGPVDTGPVGSVAQLDGDRAVVAVVPFGRLDAAAADVLAGGGPELQVTPWRSVAVPDLSPGDAAGLAARLRRAGLVLDPADPWLRVTACTGLPGCAKSRADVRSDAAAALATGRLPGGGARQHWAGCERRCGRPRGEVVDVVATLDGYLVG